MAKEKLKLKPTKYPLPLDADRMAKLEATMKERGFEYLKDAILYRLDLGFKLLSEDDELDAETVCLALDFVSQRVKCPKANQILPIYRLPCFHEYLEDHSIIEVESERANLKCAHECEFRHSKTNDGKSRLIGFFIMTLFIGHSISKLPALHPLKH